jgi:hypothetical protein
VIAGPSVRYRLPGARGNVDVRAAGALGAVLRDLVAFLAGPLAEVRGRYRLTLAEDSPVVLVATPTSRDVARSVRAMRLRFTRDLRVLEGVVAEEPGGDRADISCERASTPRSRPAFAGASGHSPIEASRGPAARSHPPLLVAAAVTLSAPGLVRLRFGQPARALPDGARSPEPCLFTCDVGKNDRRSPRHGGALPR